MKKIILSLLITAFLSNTLLAQGYNTALGVRIGMATYNGFGATLTQRLVSGLCAEGMYQSTDNRYASGLMLKWHEPFLPIFGRGWNYYFGLGGHYGGYHADIDQFRTKSANFYGGSAMLGTEFTIGRVNIGLDWMPSYSFKTVANEPTLKHDVAFSVRFVLFKAPKNKSALENLGKIFKDEGENMGGKKKKESKEL
jgi:hypothetical protein